MLQYFYIEEQLSVQDIARRLKCGPATVCNRLYKHKIDVRKAGGANNSHRIRKHLQRMDQRIVFSTINEALSDMLSCSTSTVYKYKRSVKAVRSQPSHWKFT